MHCAVSSPITEKKESCGGGQFWSIIVRVKYSFVQAAMQNGQIIVEGNQTKFVLVPQYGWAIQQLWWIVVSGSLILMMFTDKFYRGILIVNIHRTDYDIR